MFLCVVFGVVFCSVLCIGLFTTLVFDLDLIITSVVSGLVLISLAIWKINPTKTTMTTMTTTTTTTTIEECILNSKKKISLFINGVNFPLPAGHIPNPHISKKIWDALGDIVSAIEKNYKNASGDKWITLRLDGNTFKNVVDALRNLQIFAKGYSIEFEDAMKRVMRVIINTFSGSCVFAFTQSDEITIILKPASITRGKQEPHIFNGRRAKITTLTAGTATNAFVTYIHELIIQKHKDNSATILEQIKKLPMIRFDCRMGVYDTFDDAFRLVLWRAYDCGVNGLSSGILMSTIPGAKAIVGKCCDEKIHVLFQEGLLPLPPHQAYGTYVTWRTEEVEVENRMTHEKSLKSKRVQEENSDPIIVAFQGGRVFSP